MVDKKPVKHWRSEKMNKERLEEIKTAVNNYDETFQASLYGYTLDEQVLIDDYKWLIEQAEHNLVLQERLSKRGRQISGLKNALQRNRRAREKAEWNELVQRGVSDLSVRSNRKNYELNKKLKEQNKYYREIFKQIQLQILFDGTIEDHRKNIMEIIDEALESDSNE